MPERVYDWFSSGPEEEDMNETEPRPLSTVVNSALLELVEWLSPSTRAEFLGSGRYEWYLRSSHWLAMRDRMRKRAGGHCQRCHKPSHLLQVHHLTYVRLGCEKESDLTVFCPECHKAEHGVSVMSASVPTKPRLQPSPEAMEYIEKLIAEFKSERAAIAAASPEARPPAKPNLVHDRLLLREYDKLAASGDTCAGTRAALLRSKLEMKERGVRQ